MNKLEEIIDTCQFVTKNAKHVKIKEEEIKKISKAIKNRKTKTLAFK